MRNALPRAFRSSTLGCSILVGPATLSLLQTDVVDQMPVELSSRMPWAASAPAFVGRPRRMNSNSDRDQCADDRADEIDPVVVEVAADEHRGKRTAGVHRCPRHRCAPHRHEADVGANGDRPIDADVAGARRGAEDHAHEAERQDRLGQDRGPIGDARTRLGGAVEDPAVGRTAGTGRPGGRR